MTVEEKHGYKETTIRMIPYNWKLLSIGDATEVSAGGTPSTANKDYWNPPEVPWMSSGEVHQRQIFKTDKMISKLGLQNSSARVFPKKSVVMALAGQGKTRGCVAVLEAEVATNQSLAAIYPNTHFDSYYLLHNLDWRYKELRSLSSGEGGRGGLNLSIIKSIQVATPPLPEQQKIAAILTAVDDKLNVIARQIVTTQTLKEGLMQTLFRQGVGKQDAAGHWVPHVLFKKCKTENYPDSWKIVSFENVAPIIRRPVEIKDDEFYPELGLRSFGKGTFHKPALPGMKVGNKRLFKIQPGDLLFSNVFAWEGSVAVARKEDEGRFGSHRYITCKVDNRLANTSFLFRYITTPDGIELLKRASPGGAGRNRTLGLSALAAISIPLPPLDEQDKITEILDGVDAKLYLLTTKQTHYQTIKRGLMQKLLTGEWRVKLNDVALTD